MDRELSDLFYVKTWSDTHRLPLALSNHYTRIREHCIRMLVTWDHAIAYILWKYSVVKKQ
jgi:hypothetical protein